MSNKKWPRLLALVGALTLALAVIPAAGAATGTSEAGELPTYAYVNQSGSQSGGQAPHIFCKWELPDMQPGVSGMQYGGDDDPSWSHYKAYGDYPCDIDGELGAPVYEDGAEYTIQVFANPHDFPSERYIELWAAVGHEAGINAVSGVYWKIYHPDGTFKYQAHAAMHQGCGNLGSVAGGPIQAGSMFASATGTDQLSSRVVTDTSHGLVALCNEDQLRFWSGYFDLSKHQPCGEYRVEAYATATGATSLATVNFIDVYCFTQAVLDFEAVDFGLIIPGVHKQVAGNLIWGDGKPSIANIGSGGMNVGVRFYTMYQDSVSDGSEKFIDVFDAKIGINSENLEAWETMYAADTPINALQGHKNELAAHEAASFPMGRDVANGIYWFSYRDTSTVCANEVFKLDFSIQPDVRIPADSYSGTVEIWTRPDGGSDDNPLFKNPDAIRLKAPYTCNNDNGLWGGFQPQRIVSGIENPVYGANQRTSSGLLNTNPG